MAYDSETYGQSPFGNSKKPAAAESKAASSGPVAGAQPLIDDGLDRGPGELDESLTPVKPAPAKTIASAANPALPEQKSEQRPEQRPKGRPKMPESVNRLVGKLGLGRRTDQVPDIQSADRTAKANTSERQSRTTTKSAGNPTGKTTRKTTTRKRKKSQAAELARAEAEAAEDAIARRFQEEDRKAYLSLLYKTAVSALVWAVLRLLRHRLSENAISTINIIIHPLLISACAFLAVVGLTFWLRRLLNDLARHTQQLHADAEETGGKNYRPTLEIVGDALEYNPKFRKSLSLFFDAASILVCTLVSYLITSALLP